MNNQEYQKQNYLINKKRISKSKSLWYLKNRERLIEKDREYRKKNWELIKEKRKLYPSYSKGNAKSKARTDLHHAIEKGILTRLPCEVCQNPTSQAHHEDYSKPLQVIWLCSKHHGERHRKN